MADVRVTRANITVLAEDPPGARVTRAAMTVIAHDPPAVRVSRVVMIVIADAIESLPMPLFMNARF